MLQSVSRFPHLLMPLLLVTLVACSKQQEAPAPKPVAVGTLTVVSQPATITTEYVAKVEASNTVEIRSRVGGLLEKQAALEGQLVRRGQVLFEVDSQPFVAALAQARAALAQAEAGLEQSQRDLARVRPLSEIDAVSQQELDAVVARNSANVASVAAARAAMKTAELNLDYTRITSPLDGIMGRTQIRVGGLIAANTSLLTTVYASDPMYVNFSISERRMIELQRRLQLHSGDPVRTDGVFSIVLADGSAYPKPAKLNFVDAAVDQATGTLPIRLEVPNPERQLLPGMFARVIVVSEQLPNALRVPQRAVQELQGRTSLWVVGADGKAESRDVVMGSRVGTDWIVSEGLKPGETIAVDGTQKLKPGTPLSPQPLTEGPPPAGARP
ncbi:MAG TPA: efflux RND transporter periplasmic adaptor subunit [Solimonas sp.]|nr:efflux RND transporter periplasmic adaptor subunit [Solimonas sp.]